MSIVKKFAAIILSVSALGANAGAIDASKSSITATFKQLGVAVDTRFKTFGGQIDFDAANPAAAKAQLTLQVASFDIGDPEYNKEVQKKEWFNAAQFPQATFATTAIKQVGANKLQAQGKLTIKGKTLDVNVPIDFKQDTKTQTFSGSLPIKRLYFNIGEGEWKDTDTLADDIIIKFNIITTR